MNPKKLYSVFTMFTYLLTEQVPPQYLDHPLVLPLTRSWAATIHYTAILLMWSWLQTTHLDPVQGS